MIVVLVTGLAEADPSDVGLVNRRAVGTEDLAITGVQGLPRAVNRGGIRVGPVHAVAGQTVDATGAVEGDFTLR